MTTESLSAHWLFDEYVRVIGLTWSWGFAGGTSAWHLIALHERPGCEAGTETHHDTLDAAWVEARAAALFADYHEVHPFDPELLPRPGAGDTHWTRLADRSHYVRAIVDAEGRSQLNAAETLAATYRETA